MKTLATMTAVAALIAGMSIANAQNPATPAPSGAASPSNLNAGANKGGEKQSGTETPGAAMQKGTSTVQSGATPSAVSPADPNAKLGDSSDKTTSGMQPKSTQMQSGGSHATKPSTTGTGAPSPADTNAVPPSAVK